MGDDAKWERIAALGGLVFVVTAVVGAFIPGAPPSPSDSAADIAKYFHDHAGAIQAAQVLTGIGVVGLLWWFGSVYRMLTRAEAERPRMAIVAAVALAVGGALALVAGGVMSAVALRADTVGQGADLFFVLANVLLSTAAFGLVAHIAAVSSVNYRKKMLPAWITYAGWIAALALLISTIGSASDAGAFAVFGIVGFLLWCVWIVGISVAMWRGVEVQAGSVPSPA